MQLVNCSYTVHILQGHLLLATDVVIKWIKKVFKITEGWDANCRCYSFLLSPYKGVTTWTFLFVMHPNLKGFFNANWIRDTWDYVNFIKERGNRGQLHFNRMVFVLLLCNMWNGVITWICMSLSHTKYRIPFTVLYHKLDWDWIELTGHLQLICSKDRYQKAIALDSKNKLEEKTT